MKGWMLDTNAIHAGGARLHAVYVNEASNSMAASGEEACAAVMDQRVGLSATGTSLTTARCHERVSHRLGMVLHLFVVPTGRGPGM